MSKKNKAIEAETQVKVDYARDNVTAGVVPSQEKNKSKESKKNKNEKNDKNAKNTKKKQQKEKKGGIVKKTKETVSELKKVTWPTFADVVKNTGVVIAFVLLFGVFLYGVNALLGWLVSLLVG